MKLKVNLVQAKSILTKSGLPAADYVINPYYGCLFSCMYCYAAQIARWKHPSEKWGTYLDVKINAPELLKKELNNLEKRQHTKNFGHIFFSSVTDPYVGLEAKYQLTRQCLEILDNFNYEGNVIIQTKSPLATRDIDIFKRLKHFTIGYTITTLDDKVSRFLEVMAPSSTQRIQALSKLNKNNISTYAFIGPILPYFTSRADKIDEILDKLQKAGTNEVWFEHLNLNSPIKTRLCEYLQKESPDLIPYFEKANTQEYRNELEKIIQKALSGRGMKMGFGKVIHHKTLPKK